MDVQDQVDLHADSDDGVNESSIADPHSIQRLLDDTDKFLHEHNVSTSPRSSDKREVTRFSASERDGNVDQLLRDTSALLEELDNSTFTFADGDSDDVRYSDRNDDERHGDVRGSECVSDDGDFDDKLMLKQHNDFESHDDRLNKPFASERDNELDKIIAESESTLRSGGGRISAADDDEDDDDEDKFAGLDASDVSPIVAPASKYSHAEKLKPSSPIRSNETESDLHNVNRLLVRCGFAPVGLMFGSDSQGPTVSELVESLSSVLSQFEEQGTLVQSLMNEQQQYRRSQHKDAKSTQPNESADFWQAANRSLQARLNDADECIQRMTRENEDGKRTLDEQVHDLDRKLINMRQKATQAAHELKKKDDVLTKLQKKLDRVTEADERRRRTDAALFEKMFHRKHRLTSAKDSSTMEMISAFEAQRVRMQEEIDHLTALLRSSSATQSYPVPASPITPSQPPSQRVLALQDELDRARRQSQRESSLLQEQFKVVKSERDNLRQQLHSRPPLRQYKELQQNISKLQDKLREANKVSDLRKHMNTSELIRRDKDVHRLQLERLDHLPTQITKEILQDICRELGISDVSLALPALRKVLSVVRVVPQLQHFIHEVVAVVCLEQRSNIDASTAMDRILPKLRVWKSELQRLDELDDFRMRLVSLLRKRAHATKSSTEYDGEFHGQSSGIVPSKCSDIYAMVNELIDSEKSVLDSQQSFQAADATLKAHPDVLVNKIVAHFCHLFDCQGSGSVFPTMNRLFLTIQEQRNFIRCVRSTLRLDENAPLSTCMTALQELASNTPDLVLKGDIPDFESVDAVHKLKQFLNCDQPQDLIGTCRKLKDRCDLYDGMFPRVDNVLKSLFELLGVDALEHIVPAVRSLSMKF